MRPKNHVRNEQVQRLRPKIHKLLKDNGYDVLLQNVLIKSSKYNITGYPPLEGKTVWDLNGTQRAELERRLDAGQMLVEPAVSTSEMIQGSETSVAEDDGEESGRRHEVHEVPKSTARSETKIKDRKRPRQGSAPHHNLSFDSIKTVQTNAPSETTLENLLADLESLKETISHQQSSHEIVSKSLLEKCYLMNKELLLLQQKQSEQITSNQGVEGRNIDLEKQLGQLENENKELKNQIKELENKNKELQMAEETWRKLLIQQTAPK